MDYYVGEIRMFGGDYAPEGWHLCDGALLPISNYQALYALIGTTYGGNGISDFALPDFRGRLPIGQGQGASLTARVVGQKSGSETVTLTVGQVPSHTHSFMAANAPASTVTPGSSVVYAQTQSGFLQYVNANAVTPTPDNVLSANSVTPAGGEQAHNNVMPSLVVNFIIALQGLYPTRS